MSISLPDNDVEFLDRYAQAFAEWDDSSENDVWDKTAADGIGDLTDVVGANAGGDQVL